MADFLFLYRGPVQTGSPEQMQQSMNAWMTWLKDLGERGHLKDRGHALQDGGKVVKGKSVQDGPFTETKDIVGGFSLVTARDLAQATELTHTCPGVLQGGSVEVRPLRLM